LRPSPALERAQMSSNRSQMRSAVHPSGQVAIHRAANCRLRVNASCDERDDVS
jgi:hypothetical protein